MDVIDHNLELIQLSKRYEVRRNSEGNRYSVYDKESVLSAFYDTDDKKWTYCVSDVCNPSSQFVEVPVGDLNSLIEFTNLLMTERGV